MVDGQEAIANSPFTTTLISLDIDDDENDEVDTIGLPLTSAREINVNNTGRIITLAYDDANEDNEFNKQALAGESIIIASYDVRADNEEIEVEELFFTLDGPNIADLQRSVRNATILLDGVEIETNTSGDINADGTIVFDDLRDLIFPTSTAELQLQLNTATIGEDEIGEPQTGLFVTDVEIVEAEGVDSGEDLRVDNIAKFSGIDSRTLDIVSALITPSVVDEFGTDDSTAELRLSVEGGNNTTANGDRVEAEVTGLTFTVTSLRTNGTITVLNSNDLVVGTGVFSTQGAITVPINSDSIDNDDEIYTIETTAEAVFRLTNNGVAYTINGQTPSTTQLESNLDL